MSAAGAPATAGPGTVTVGPATAADRPALAELARAAGVPAPAPERTWAARGPAGGILGFLTERRAPGGGRDRPLLEAPVVHLPATALGPDRLALLLLRRALGTAEGAHSGVALARREPAPAAGAGPRARVHAPDRLLAQEGWEPWLHRLELHHPLTLAAPPAGMRFASFRPSREPTFAGLYRASFRGSLDRAAAAVAADPDADWAALRRGAGREAWRSWFCLEDPVRGAVGLCCLTATGTSGGWCVQYLGVVPSARGRGYGRWLAEEAVRRAATQGAPELTLEVDRENTPALGAYRAAGFAIRHPVTVFAARGRAGVPARGGRDEPG